MADEPKVTVPPLDDASLTPDAAQFWFATGAFLGLGVSQLGEDKALGLFLSRATRELRRRFGVEGARKYLQGYIDTMEEAAKYDAGSDTNG